MIKICDLPASTLYLFKEQTYKGRCNVVYHNHCGDIHALPEEERNAFFADVAKVGAAVSEAFTPDKVNYGAYADKMQHIHMHIVPKYKDGKDFGAVFEMNPQKVYLAEDEYAELIEQIQAKL